MASIIEINGRKWLAGMAWCSFEDIPNKDEIKEDAGRLKSDWYSVRVGQSVIQAGFSSPIEGIKRPNKIYSLAAMLADAKEQPWLGIFKIGEGLWWYIAVRDGHAILPDGDIVGGEEEIREAQDRHSGYTDWKYVEGDLSFLSELIDGIDAKATPIKSLSAGINLVPLISITLTIAAIGGGYYWWHQKQLVEAQEKAAAMERIRSQMAINTAQSKIAPSPLLTSPEPKEWLTACAKIIKRVPISQYSWEMSELSCGQSAVNVTWIRKEGATVMQKPTGDLSDDGEKISQSIPLEISQVGKDDGVKLRDSQLAMRAWAQSANIQLGMTATAAQAAPPLPGAKPEDIPPPPTPQVSVRLEMPISPFNIDFSSVHGLRLNSLKSSTTGWVVEGFICGK